MAYYGTFFTQRDDYWKLQDYRSLTVKQMRATLAERNYHVGSTRDTGRLRRCLRRSDMGLMSYANYTNKELRQLIRARGIKTDFGPRNIGQRVDLIEALEHADNNRKFENFTRLPPELRNRVYEYYFSEFKKTLLSPKQPPLTLVCNLVRRETLPIFYANCTFELNLVARWFSGGTGFLNLIMPADTLLWLYATRAENFADIQHIEVKVWKQGPWDRIQQLLTFSVANSKAETSRCIRLNPEKSAGENRHLLRRELLKVVQDVTTRKKGWKLKKEDFFALRRAVEASFA